MLNKILIALIALMLSFELSAQTPRDVEVTVYLIDIEEFNTGTTHLFLCGLAANRHRNSAARDAAA